MEDSEILNYGSSYEITSINKDMTTKEYSNGDVTIVWKPELCEHAGVCVRTLPKVYNPKAKPWVTPEHATSQEIIDQVAMCPSGALSMKG